MSRRLQIVAAVVTFWLFAAGVLLVAAWPWMPSTSVGWLSFLVLGPALYFLGEVFFSWLFSAEHGRRISGAQFLHCACFSRLSLSCSCSAALGLSTGT